MDFEFVRHEPVYDRMIFVLTLDRQKMKERILVGEEQEIRFRLQGDGEADVLCDVTRPLGSLLAEFEHDPDREWNLNGLSPLREALHTNRWSQPALEQKAGDFLTKKYLTGDPVRMFAAFRIWNGYLQARLPREREEACERFMKKMGSLTAVFMGDPVLKFDPNNGKPRLLELSHRIYGMIPAEDTRLDLWYPDSRRDMECVAAYASGNAKSAAKCFLPAVCGMNFAVRNAGRNNPSRTSGTSMNGQGKTTMTCSIKMSARAGATRSTVQRSCRIFPPTGWLLCSLPLKHSKRKP